MSSSGTSTTRERSVTERKRRADAGSMRELLRGDGLQARHLLQRAEQPLHAHRLHQVVDGVDLERLHRVLVERRGEDHHRRMRELEQVARELDAVHVRHVDVGQHEIGGRALQQIERLATVLRLADDGERQRGRRNRRADRAAGAAQAPRRRRPARAAAAQPCAPPCAGCRAQASRDAAARALPLRRARDADAAAAAAVRGTASGSAVR